MKRILSFFIIVFLAFPALPRISAAAASSATVSVEAFTVGSGYLVSPTAVEADGNENAAQTLLRLLAENGYTAYYGGTPESAFYLAYVADGTKTAAYNGYTCAAALYPPAAPKPLPVTTRISEPLKNYLTAHAAYFDEYDYETNARGYLGEFVYTDLSGWMYSLNGVYRQTDLASVTLRPGDVLRVQYTLCLGADVGGADADTQAAFNAAMQEDETTTAAPETTTKAPETTTKAPETTTKAPETTTKAPETTTEAPETTTKAPETTTTAPETTTEAPETTTKAPETTTEAPETTTEAPETTTAAGPAPEKSPSGGRITVISAAAAVPVTAAAVLIIIKKKKENHTQ